MRSVLSQGYWPESHLAAPSADALRAEVQLIKDLGFNATRMHQKFEDPRFLFWADRLGLLVWARAAGAFTFTPDAAERTVREWLEVMHRDLSHPSIVTWVPLNESWGVQHIAHDASMLHFVRALVHLTKALDPTRPVVSNDGWEHADPTSSRSTTTKTTATSCGRATRPRRHRRTRVGDRSCRAPAGAPRRRHRAAGHAHRIRRDLFDVHRTEDAWGYTDATSSGDFAAAWSSLMAAVHDSAALAGYCYTQLTDTQQETNGLVGSDRKPKLPLAELREIMVGPRATRAPE